MKSFYNFRHYVTVIVTTISISLSVELKSNFEKDKVLFFIIAIIISGLVSLVFGDLTAQFLFRLKWFRKIIMDRSSIEGFWMLEPLNIKEQGNIFNAYALAEIYFDSLNFSLQTTVYRLNEKKEILQSSSNNITYIGLIFEF